ncbi:hypothetical protein B0T26DRAFT_367621 [Lasiosphaeria miniovina]|uniref:Uncharacterized protein n=1 Tax=Lasiosphaeria miniovina TaxID=1954250 RepID=A0AA40DRL8_9PEZI|nr:uncharacterized protein B0T26DRAFT_367621 [Lasiosphaeria miniovina]KAK0713629.1 hypothetical protein B0T26DRAFT_367621 [Lasiosphaeria miniovina]
MEADHDPVAMAGFSAKAKTRKTGARVDPEPRFKDPEPRFKDPEPRFKDPTRWPRLLYCGWRKASSVVGWQHVKMWAHRVRQTIERNN